jgi:TRAP transporter 4TM/12TM fusion protein
MGALDVNTAVVDEVKSARQPSAPWLRKLAFVVAVAMAGYHMYVAGWGPPEAMIFRGTHLMFAFVLVFLLYPSRLGGHLAWRAVDFVLLALAAASVGYIFLTYSVFTNRIIYIDDLNTLDKTFAVLNVLLVLEATRRVIGWALPLTAIAFVTYAAGFTQVKFQVLLEQLYYSTEGIFGSTLGVSASYVMLFVIFGAFMEKSGTGRLFMDFALSLTGRSAGGPGKVAVVSSSLFGTVSGSAVANVMVDGPITIPLMKRSGFRPPFAAAVESVASTGGQLMPPVMGAAAFVMAEFLSVPYAQVALWALLPAVLYYVAVFCAVHFEARRHGLQGLPAHEVPLMAQVLLERGHLFIPILIILVGLLMGYSAPLCALVAAVACLPVAMLRATTREGLRWGLVWEALEEGARNALSVAMACACAGVVIGCVTITGLGIVFTQVVIALAQDSLLLALLLTAVAGIVLGMGMPTTPAYIVMAALLIPALVKMGVATPAAHMFAFYFAILSAITPPVALAVFAAAGLAKANIWESGFSAMRAAAPAYIVPFMFVYEPQLLLIVKGGAEQWLSVAGSAVTACAGVVLLAGSLFGWLAGPASRTQRVVLFVAALCLIKPGLWTDLLGLGLAACVMLWQRSAGSARQPG